MERLVTVIQQLSLARDLEAVMEILRRATRSLTGADGTTIVLREKDLCVYVDEDAISPLWKGQRFPINACISGWCMEHRQAVAIADIYDDDRIPIDAYRPTFIKSLVMVPIRIEAPIGAIGTYWATHHQATQAEVQLLQALADTTAVTLENIQMHSELEQRVRDRTAQLQATNQELEALSSMLSHDLRAPLSVVNMAVGLLQAKYAEALGDKGKTYLTQVCNATQRIDQMIDKTLNLHKVTQFEMKPEVVDLSRLAAEILAELQAGRCKRDLQTMIWAGLTTYGDPILLRSLLENLLSNAWKYTAKRSQAMIEFGVNAAADGLQTFFIQDNGVGFDPKAAQNLFTPFQRLHAEQDFPGTGIGLASAQRIVHKHGGQIWCEAVPNQGATFYFSLPEVPFQI